MCGRFTLTLSPELLAQIFNVPLVPGMLGARYNIAPTQPVATILQPSTHEDKQFRMLKWGLVPSWAKDPKIGAKMINARAETVMEKPSFRTPFRRQRCLIPSDGFYEWSEAEGGKQPIYIRRQDRGVFAFAGLWDRWENNSEVIESCTILTTEPNDLLKKYHHRMAVMLQPEDYDIWTDPELTDAEPLLELLKPYPTELLEAFLVNKTVNKATNESPECIQPAEQSLF